MRCLKKSAREPRAFVVNDVPRSVRSGHLSDAPDVDGEEQEQPDNIDEMPIPCARLKTKMMQRRKRTPVMPGPYKGDKEGTDDHMNTMETGGKIERASICGICYRSRV